MSEKPKTSLEMRVMQGGKTRAMTSVTYPPTKEALDAAYELLDFQIAEAEASAAKKKEELEECAS